jgi:hypothetical protein
MPIENGPASIDQTTGCRPRPAARGACPTSTSIDPPTGIIRADHRKFLQRAKLTVSKSPRRGTAVTNR